MRRTKGLSNFTHYSHPCFMSITELIAHLKTQSILEQSTCMYNVYTHGDCVFRISFLIKTYGQKCLETHGLEL